MNLPYLALYMVREFSRPMTRPDWRSCKIHESHIIQEHVGEFLKKHRMIFSMIGEIDPFRMKKYIKVNEEVNEWTHYGRALILKRNDQHPGWRRAMPVPIVQPALITEPEWYFYQYRWFMSPHYLTF
jgi:hypothetical protein